MTKLSAPLARGPGYWQAESLAQASLIEFRAAQERADLHGERAAFYRVAWYHHRTLHILNRALEARHESLAGADDCPPVTDERVLPSHYLFHELHLRRGHVV